MEPRPRADDGVQAWEPRLGGRVALITGGDSGIGRAVAIAFAKEGADVAIAYLDEHADAEETARDVRALGRRCATFAGNVADEAFCRATVDRVAGELGGLHVLVNNAAEQHPVADLREIDTAVMERTFRTNVFAMFFATKAALAHLGEGAAIINTTSITAYKGSAHLVDYAATKGAIVAFTRSLAAQLVDRGIRVNAVAPGPVWTPLIPASFPADQVAEFGRQAPMGRPAQPEEIAPSYVFLACGDSSYMSGQVLHPNGGTVVNG